MKNKILEELAELEHQQWQQWAQNSINKRNVPEQVKSRWQKYFVPYQDLSEEVKELDRVYARKVLAIFERYKKENI